MTGENYTKVLTSGGLGDAAMAVGKIYSKHAPFDPQKIEVIHARTKKALSNAISDFYELQGVKHKIVQMKNWNELDNVKKNFKTEHFLGSGWSKDNHEDPDSWEIEPFPPFNFTYLPADVVINPISGRDGKRKLDIDEIREFIKRYPDRVTLIGKTDDHVYANKINKIGQSVGAVNKTTLEEVVGILCSCKTVITPEGFVAYLSSMAKKQVFVSRQNKGATMKRKHPQWNMTFFNKLNQVEL